MVVQELVLVVLVSFLVQVQVLVQELVLVVLVLLERRSFSAAAYCGGDTVRYWIRAIGQ